MSHLFCYSPPSTGHSIPNLSLSVHLLVITSLSLSPSSNSPLSYVSSLANRTLLDFVHGRQTFRQLRRKLFHEPTPILLADLRLEAVQDLK